MALNFLQRKRSFLIYLSEMGKCRTLTLVLFCLLTNHIKVHCYSPESHFKTCSKSLDSHKSYNQNCHPSTFYLWKKCLNIKMNLKFIKFVYLCLPDKEPLAKCLVKQGKTKTLFQIQDLLGGSLFKQIDSPLYPPIHQLHLQMPSGAKPSPALKSCGWSPRYKSWLYVRQKGFKGKHHHTSSKGFENLSVVMFAFMVAAW